MVYDDDGFNFLAFATFSTRQLLKGNFYGYYKQVAICAERITQFEDTTSTTSTCSWSFRGFGHGARNPIISLPAALTIFSKLKLAS